MNDSGHEFRDSLKNKIFAIGNTISCPGDGSGGAQWRITTIDEEGNLHAKLIDEGSGSQFYKKTNTIIIIPEAYDNWEVVPIE